MDEKYYQILDQYERLEQERDRHWAENFNYPIANDPLTLLEDSIERIYSPTRYPNIPDFYPKETITAPNPPRTDPRALGPPASNISPPHLPEHSPSVNPEPWFHLRPPARGHQLGSHSGRFPANPGTVRRHSGMADRLVLCPSEDHLIDKSVCYRYCPHWQGDRGCTYGKDEEEESEEREAEEEEI